MPTELTPLTAYPSLRSSGAGPPEPRPAATSGSASAQAVASEPLTRRAVDPSQELDRASRAAARAMFKGRDVEVTSFLDKGTGRTVYRVADRSSGEVLHQSPPDALLRFFASTRAALSKPLVAVEA